MTAFSCSGIGCSSLNKIIRKFVSYCQYNVESFIVLKSNTPLKYSAGEMQVVFLLLLVSAPCLSLNIAQMIPLLDRILKRGQQIATK